MSKPDYIDLYTVKKNVVCISCGNRGAVKHYGNYYYNGLQDDTPNSHIYEEYRNKEYLSKIGGFGGTIPYECLNCGLIGLVDFDGLEGFKKQFKEI